MTTLVRWNPAREFVNAQRQMDRMFGDVFGREWASNDSGARPLALDVYHTDEAYVVEAALPGFSPETVAITVEDNVLTLNAKLEESTEDEGKTYLLRERRTAAYQRQLRLPKNINTEAVSAKFENGMLTISLPKAEEAKPKRISVNIA